MTHEHDHEPDEWDLGLAHDLQQMVQRRTALKMLAGAGAAALLAACASETTTKHTAGTTAQTTGSTTAATTADSTDGTTATTANTTAATTGHTPTEIPTANVPEETSGPYPGDGSNGPDILTEPDVVRSDITTSIGSFAGTAEGVPTSISLVVLDSGNNHAPLTNAAVYLWHADKDGHYSMYTAPDASYLRGVQETDANGIVTFHSIWPGCYDGRWPHVHFEVYPSLADALEATNKIVTSQIALPEAECAAVYGATGYEASVTNLTHTSLATDMVFRDGWDQELGTATGDNDNGWAVSLTISV